MAPLFPTQEIGSLPKPAWLTKAPARGHATPEEIKDAHHWGSVADVPGHDSLIKLLKAGKLQGQKGVLRDWAALYNLRYLESAGLDYVYDGEARRVEMYEHPIKRTEGFTFLGLVKSFDYRYYRKAASTGKVAYKDPWHLEELAYVQEHARRAIKVPITGPYTLADWSFNEYYLKKLEGTGTSLKERKALAKQELAYDLAKDAVRPNIQALVKAGADFIQIDEPAAATQPEESELFVETLNRAMDGIDCKFSVHICFSDYRRLFPQLLEMKKCSQWVWEFANRDKEGVDGYTALDLFREYNDGREIGLGVSDVHVDEVESPELIADRIRRAAKRLGDPSRLYVNPDCGLRTRSFDIAYEKLVNIVKGAEIVRTEFT